ncbi:MAG: endo-1,4-beta-xylanase [Deltaproteobacteria bacterium]|nr:endo-1,4-beta-xylanase [Deltaproteobacteria bacterium]MBN2670436.1 endo-1,4-beta-xylanase [Deltaproteobacteria bacterium]
MPKFVGNITTSYSNSVDYDGMTFSDYWDQITPENAGKWGSVEPNAGGPRSWSALDAIYAYTEDHNIIFKQHAFIWGSQQPNNAAILQEVDVKSWMNEFCTRYPNTRLIDVVNEPPPHTTPDFANNIGGGTNTTWAWITNSFNWAKDACPDAILILNDYNNIEWSGDNQHFIDIANTIQNAGAPIDAIGAQSHDLDHASISTQTMQTLIAKLHNDTGLPVYITEYDISTTSDAEQLAKYQEHIPFFLNTDYIHGITIWGWIYGQTWSQAPYSGLVDNGNPRSAMTWLMNTLGRPVP